MVVPLSQNLRDTLFLEEYNNWEEERCLKRKRLVYSCFFCLFVCFELKKHQRKHSMSVFFSVFGAEI